MNSGFLIGYIIGLIIQVVILVCFFVLCYRIGRIKDTLCVKKDGITLFNYYVAIGEKEKAKNLIEKYVYDEIIYMSDKGFDDKNIYSYIVEKYKEPFHNVDLDITILKEMIHKM